MTGALSRWLVEVDAELERILTRGIDTAPTFAISQLTCTTTWVDMRDGVKLSTDLYLPPVLPAPAIAVRTPYGRGGDRIAGTLMAIARRGYAVVSQDCRGTGESEPDRWDYYMYEAEDGFDLVEWISRQAWFEGFLGSCGGSYLGQTQWSMSLHPRMTTIVPEVSGLGIAGNTAHLHMFLNAFARSVGKGAGKTAVPPADLERALLAETLAGGIFNEPIRSHEVQRKAWERYCSLGSAQRAAFVREAMGTDDVSIAEVEALSVIFGPRIAHDAHSIPHANPSALCRSLHAPALMLTGWYDWALNDALATWQLLRCEGRESVRSQSRLVIAPSAHAAPGYHEGMAEHVELQRNHRTANHVDLLLRWYGAVRKGTTQAWPGVVYYLMGANRWCVADEWPPTEVRSLALYLASDGVLSRSAPVRGSAPDRFTYDPGDPTPTVGGSILSSVYLPGSVDVSHVQERSDVLAYTTPPLEADLDVVGPLRLILYASSSARDTDFCARLSDVFPDGRAIQLQSGMLRARYRRPDGAPELLDPGRPYRFEIDMWATANRFRAGHRIRLDISSADFPRFDRNSNRGGEPGPPVPATQTIYHDHERPSELILSLLVP